MNETSGAAATASSAGHFPRSAVVLPEVRFLSCLFSGWAAMAGEPFALLVDRSTPVRAEVARQVDVLAAALDTAANMLNSRRIVLGGLLAALAAVDQARIERLPLEQLLADPTRRATSRKRLKAPGSLPVPGCSWASWMSSRAGSRRARDLLEEALNLSPSARSTPFVALNLTAYARLASAEGDLERAALLQGAAEGLRRRGGRLKAWPMLRRGETELVAQVRQTLGTTKFGDVFAASTRLSQREAVSAVRNRSGTDGSS